MGLGLDVSNCSRSTCGMTRKNSRPDHHTKIGRKQIDDQVRAALHATEGQTRNKIGTGLSLEPHVVSASLLRLEKEGSATRTGTTSKTLWFRAQE